MSSISYPDIQSIGNTEQPKRTADMGSILSVDPKIVRSDIRVAHAAVFTAAQKSDILQVLAVGAAVSNPRITPAVLFIVETTRRVVHPKMVQPNIICYT